MNRQNADRTKKDIYIKDRRYTGEVSDIIRSSLFIMLHSDQHPIPEDTIMEIVSWAKREVHIEHYIKPSMDEYQIFQIGHCMMNGLDARLLSNPLLLWDQMVEIRLGLEMGIDVTKYNIPSIPSAEMNKIRYKLYAEKINFKGEY